MTDSTMYGLLVRHDVSDFEQFQKAFAGHEKLRREAGVVMHVVHREDGNDKQVIVYLGSPSLEGLQGMLASDELKAAMKDASVVSAPEIQLVQNRAMALDPDPGAGAGVIISHEVADFGSWMKAFEQHDGARRAGGAVGSSVNTLVDDGNHVVAYIQSKDVAALRAFTAAPELAEAMKAAGVTSEPRITFTQRAEMKRYE